MPTVPSPFALKNIRLFIAFRVFFNARFYYPVFTILFLDFGLSIEQFALLNTVWAITIVVAEVPSGALADIFGRKYLIVATSMLMVIEMSVLAFVPLGNSNLIFWAFLVNRVLSGLAEAMASGADEAIAYDTLVESGNPKDWPRVLSVQMRLRSVFSIITATTGALIYDPSAINKLFYWFGSSSVVDQQITMRFPIYLTLVLAVLATGSALRMTEHGGINTKTDSTKSMEAIKKTLQAGSWIFKTPLALAIILFGMVFDHIIRMIVTMTSQYYRLIHLPEASFGLIASMMALLGLLTPKIAEFMVEKNSAVVNVIWVAGITLTGLFGLTGFFQYWGVIPMAFVFVGITFVSFFTSHYLNAITESHQRATVLSFKGLAFNLAYGLIGIFFAQIIVFQRNYGHSQYPGESAEYIEVFAFQEAVGLFPWYAIVCLAIVSCYCYYSYRKQQISEDNKKAGY